MLSNLSALNMGVQNLQNFQQHSDVLEKIKMQVRDFSALHPSFTSSLQTSLGFNPAQNHQNALQSNADTPNGFPFASPTPAANKDGKLKLIWEFNLHFIEWLMDRVLQARTHRPRAKRPTRRSRTMAGASRSNSSKFDRWAQFNATNIRSIRQIFACDTSHRRCFECKRNWNVIICTTCEWNCASCLHVVLSIDEFAYTSGLSLSRREWEKRKHSSSRMSPDEKSFLRNSSEIKL